MVRGPRTVIALAVTGAILWLACPPVLAAAQVAAADQSVTRLRADARVARDGALHVVETQRYAFGTVPVDEVHRSFQTRVRYDDDFDQVFTVSGFRASLDGRRVGLTRDDSGASDAVTLGFDRPVTGQHTLTLSYDVRGTVRRTPQGLELGWPLVQGLRTPVGSVTATLSAPGVAWAACFAGGARSTMPCTATQLGEQARPGFTEDGLAAGERMTVVVGMPPGAVSANQILERRWSLGRAFAVTPLTVGLLVGLAALAGLAVLALWWTRGRDVRVGEHREAYEPIRTGSDGGAEFVPPDSIRPGQQGTIVDETADVVDIVATVLDLAVRGFVVVEELEQTSPHRRPDWLLHRVADTDEADLAPYERVVLGLLFADARESVAVSALADSFPEELARVQDQLYADVYARGWFRQRPDAVRSRWTTAGAALALAGVVITAVLAAFTDLGLLGLGIIAAGGILAWGGDLAPARTARGSTLHARLHDFRSYLATADGSDLPEGSRAELAARILPYAVVFGLEDRWSQIFAAAGRPGDPDAGLQWYDAPTNWHRVDLPDSVDALVTTLSGAISSRRLRV